MFLVLLAAIPAGATSSRITALGEGSAFYEDDRGDVRVVLTRRPDHMPTHPGDVVFPGGHREDGEEPISTATREAWEEIGLPIENVIEVFGGLTPMTTVTVRSAVSRASAAR